ncbi:MAG: orotate phosphoribosyltransferase [Proteobacteria bacterium]|nr:orotate phosphoribosyltransferase [Pseudomonadota bacterium]
METRKKLDRLREIVRELSVIEGEITLSSGETSQFYFDMRRTACDPEGSNLIADLILDSLAEDDVDFIGGLEVGAVPIVACVSQKSFQTARPIPAFYVRKKPKEHGTRRAIEGQIREGGRVVIVDDVTTSGESVMRAVEAAREFGCTVVKVITVVDRLEGAAERFAAEGCPFVALLTADDFDLSL